MILLGPPPGETKDLFVFDYRIKQDSTYHRAPSIPGAIVPRGRGAGGGKGANQRLFWILISVLVRYIVWAALDEHVVHSRSFLVYIPFRVCMLYRRQHAIDQSNLPLDIPVCMLYRRKHAKDQSYHFFLILIYRSINIIGWAEERYRRLATSYIFYSAKKIINIL